MRVTKVSSLYRYLRRVINRTHKSLLLTHHRGFQAGRVFDRNERVIYVIQADLASCLELVNVVEQPEGKCSTWFFPCRRKPLHIHELSTTKSRRSGFATEAVGDTDGMNTGDVEESELGWDRWYYAMFANAMAELVYDTEVGKGLSGKERSCPSLWLR